MSPEFDVRYTAQLARLQLTEEEATQFQSQISKILGYVENLKKVDVHGIEATAHANSVCNVFRADEPHPWFDATMALANAPRQGGQLFIVPKVIE